jgi:hypothetical protein
VTGDREEGRRKKEEGRRKKEFFWVNVGFSFVNPTYSKTSVQKKYEITKIKLL